MAMSASPFTASHAGAWHHACAAKVVSMKATSDDQRDFVGFIGRLKETQTLLAVAQALSLRLDAPEAMRRVCREVAVAFGADTVGAYAPDPTDAGALLPIGGYHVPARLREWFGHTPFPIASSPALAAAWRHGTP